MPPHLSHKMGQNQGVKHQHVFAAMAVITFCINAKTLAAANIPVYIVGQHNSSHLYPRLNLSRAGICTLEVPTIDLINPDERATIPIPAGNGSRTGYSRIEICCSGWERKSHTHFQCQPVCDNGCDNGNCTAPNVCACKSGYVKNARDGKCIPTCPTGCLHGVCTTQGICSCNAGHVLDRTGTFCSPVCKNGCGIGGECVAAETCKCYEGYSLDSSTNQCEYHCEGGCGQGGSCVGPNKCTCSPGYVRISGKCSPHCPQGCKDGVCSAPNTCTCSSGWNLDSSGSICQPHCTQPCLNADCTAPETCTCKKGYTKSGGSVATSYKCVAHCPEGCPNGVCTAPNFCICNQGFVKEMKGSNNCIRRLKRDLSQMHFELIPPHMSPNYKNTD